MDFTLSYLAVHRLGELINLKASTISPMNDLAYVISDMHKRMDQAVLARLDELLLSQGLLIKTEVGTGPAPQMHGFLRAVFEPAYCIQARVREAESCSDTYFIPYDGAWIRLDACRGQFTVSGPYTEAAVGLYLRTCGEMALDHAGIYLQAERRSPQIVHSAVIYAEEEGYQFLGCIMTPLQKSQKTYYQLFEKNPANREWILDMVTGRRDFILPETEQKGVALSGTEQRGAMQPGVEQNGAMLPGVEQNGAMLSGNGKKESGQPDNKKKKHLGKRLLISLAIKLVMAVVSMFITAIFANTLFSGNPIANQIFAACFFYFLIVSVSRLIQECRRGGIGSRLKRTLGNMVKLKPPALWFFLAALIIALFLPYPLVLSLGLWVFCIAVSGEGSRILKLKRAMLKRSPSEKDGTGLAATASGLLLCGLVVCLLSAVGVPSVYGLLIDRDKKVHTETTVVEDQGNGDHAEDLSAGDTGNDWQDGDSRNDGWQDDDSQGDGSWDDGSQGDGSWNDGSQDDNTESDILAAAQQLADDIITYAGGDRDAFDALFRNTDPSIIEQYYNTSFEQFREFDHSLVAIAAQDETYVWFTVLYYTIPEGYPTQKEQSLYLSTIMSLADGEWKIEYSDEARARLQEEYDNASFTEDGYDAKENGRPWAKFFIPFHPEYDTLFYDDAVMCKLIEMYVDAYGDVQLTLYISNGTQQDIIFTGVPDITVIDGKQELFSVGADMGFTVSAGEVCLCTVTIDGNDVDFNGWNSPKIANMEFAYESLE